MAEGEYIWERADWPRFTYDLASLTPMLVQVSRMQGLLFGRLANVGLALQTEASLVTLTDDVVKTSEIEGEHLNADSVRSSIARRLGVDIGALAPADRQIDGVVDMVLDATANFVEPLSAQRLFGWHANLFPTGYSGSARIEVGQWRTDSTGPMQVVSSPIGRQRVHFEAPPAHRLDVEISRFLDWSNATSTDAPLIRAGLAHLWFVTIHPFDDGNGRIARALGDLFLARSDDNKQRFYSLSAQIQRQRSTYYDALERTQRGTLDVTSWLAWFLTALHDAIQYAHKSLETVLRKAEFWQRWAANSLNDRHVQVLNRLLDGFEGNLTTSKWAALAKCSTDTALRDITGLIALGALRKSTAGGRSTSYELAR
jgi:Fic family protein